MEAAVALGAGDLDELERLRALAEGDDELQARTAACLADHFILRGDPVAAMIAAQALVSMPARSDAGRRNAVGPGAPAPGARGLRPVRPWRSAGRLPTRFWTWRSPTSAGPGSTRSGR